MIVGIFKWFPHMYCMEIYVVLLHSHVILIRDLYRGGFVSKPFGCFRGVFYSVRQDSVCLVGNLGGFGISSGAIPVVYILLGLSLRIRMFFIAVCAYPRGVSRSLSDCVFRC